MTSPFQKAAARLDEVIKHFGAADSRHPSAIHGPKDTQEVHGNRPGSRTQSTILSSADLKPDGFDDAGAVEQLDYFLRAAGQSTPVVQAGDRFWLAPPSASMLEERGAGDNLEVGDAPEPHTNFAEGLEEADKLQLPAPAESEEGKRFLEAAAEHRKNNNEGPTTPRFEEMFGDQLRASHPKRAPKTYGGRLTSTAQAAVARDLAKKKRPGLPLQQMQAINAFINVLGNRPSTTSEMAFIHDILQALSLGTGDVPGRRSGSTAQPPTGAQPTAEEQAQQGKQTPQDRAEDERAKEKQRAVSRGQRLPRRLPNA